MKSRTPGGDTPPAETTATQGDINLDLGFGAVVARESRRRLLNRDGSFNVRRTGLGALRSLSMYHAALTMSWPHFLAWTVGAYLGVNLLFALGFLACGSGALMGVNDMGAGGRIGQAFFFSVETLATIGYGNIVPATLAANILVTVESLVGLLGFSIGAGLFFGRVSRPTAAIIFSDRAVIAPYRGITAFQFRIANARTNQIVELSAKVLLNRRRPGSADREFRELTLERDSVTFFPLSWTIVHPIDESSPMFGVSEQQLRESDAEFLILLTGTDETFAQTVHTRSSYKPAEIVFGARFTNILVPRESGDEGISIDVSRVHEIEAVALSP